MLSFREGSGGRAARIEDPLPHRTPSLGRITLPVPFPGSAWRDQEGNTSHGKLGPRGLIQVWGGGCCCPSSAPQGNRARGPKHGVGMAEGWLGARRELLEGIRMEGVEMHPREMQPQWGEGSRQQGRDAAHPMGTNPGSALGRRGPQPTKKQGGTPPAAVSPHPQPQ